MKKYLFLVLFLLSYAGQGHAGNLIFMDRFNGDLSAWTLDQSGGTASILTHDYSTKLQLFDTGAGSVSATHAFAEPPGGKYILEYDINYQAGALETTTLLDSGNNPIITISTGTGLVSFSTDTATVSTATFTSGIYKQIVLVVDKTLQTASCYLSQDNTTYGSLDQIGGAKSYTGTPISSLKFSTGASQTGTIYLDEVRIYTPDIFFIGDSRWDGKPLWSTHPGYPSGRLSASSDETSPPTYQLALKYTSTWVADRAFGGSTTSQVDAQIQSAVLDQGAQRVCLDPGHNDIYILTSLPTITASYTSILNKTIASGVTGSNIIMTTVFTSSLITAGAGQAELAAFNSWVLTKCASIGATCVDIAPLIANPSNPAQINPAYDVGDHIHLNKLGSGVVAQAIYNALYTTPSGTGGGGGNLGSSPGVSNLGFSNKISRLH